jgi:Leucine-rich repeat (LRR) protein
LSTLPKLHLVDIQNTPVTDVSSLANLPELLELKVTGSDVADVSMLKQPGLQIVK